MNRAKIFIAFTFLFSFSFQISAQRNPFPNELEGYKFFSMGRLKDLKLGSSKKNDVEKIFGEGCKKFCDYDENFQIKFKYLAALDDCMTTEDIRDRAMCPQKDFVDTISSVAIKPKQSRILKELSTSTFNKVSSTLTAKKADGISISYTSFADKYGLIYSINEKSGKAALRFQYPSFIGGELYSVEYIFNDDFIRKVFTIEYMTRKKELNQ